MRPTLTGEEKAARITVFGVVQGVGFRPFIFRLARSLRYKGWVKNAGFGVEIHLEGGRKPGFDNFLKALQKEKPPLSRIETVKVKAAAFRKFKDFRIVKSRAGAGFVFISPDIAACTDCLEEIRAPRERRFRYPFTNCTNCGPRYTIVRSLPYDRSETTMAGFPMCPDCASEYDSPLDRRYHAQPIACPVCGPQVRILKAGTRKIIEGGIGKAAELIRRGKVLAVKGIGGFHLVCDALNPRAVERIRRVKQRRTKPLALMARDLGIAGRYAWIGRAEREWLASPSRPIVLLKKKKDIPGIAPHLGETGIMLPYAPLHSLLLENLLLIVATSSNIKDAPIMKSEEEGLDNLCDYILTHNRPIATRADDSVVKIAAGSPLFVRRARGYVPYPQPVPEGLRSSAQVLALGGELKDTLSVYKNGYVVTSQFLGDLDEYRNLGYFEETLSHLCRLFDIRPDVVVTDLHPDFRTTRFAAGMGIPHLRVQHHYAHVLAPMLEHGVEPGKKVLGIAWDGYGYGEDGKAWGGEFFYADYLSHVRAGHFKEVALPGGDLAARQPWRMALSYLRESYGSNFPSLPVFGVLEKNKTGAVREMMDKAVHSPLTSSCGRLFDAVSFLCGIAPVEMEFEAEAAMRLEAVATATTLKSYDVSLNETGPTVRISFEEAVRQIIKDLKSGTPVPIIATKFHNSLARLIVRMADKARKDMEISTVVLVGGVFLNKKLLVLTTRLLKKHGFEVLRPVSYSPSDESLSLGQVAHALAGLSRPKA